MSDSSHVRVYFRGSEWARYGTVEFMTEFTSKPYAPTIRAGGLYTVLRRNFKNVSLVCDGFLCYDDTQIPTSKTSDELPERQRVYVAVGWKRHGETTGHLKES